MVSVTMSYYPQKFAFEGSKLLLDICLADSRILYFWYVLKSIHKFIIELHALQCLFVRGSNKKQRRGLGLFEISQKVRLFHILWQPSTLGGNLIMQSFFLHPSKKPSSPLQFGKEENIPGHSIERKTYWFILKIDRSSPFRWVGIGWWALL